MLTWETSTTGNIGIDITALNNRLSFTGDIYQRWTDDMYTVGPSVPAYSAPVFRKETTVRWRPRDGKSPLPGWTGST